MSNGQRNIYDFKMVKSVSAIALMYESKLAGKIVCNWSDNKAGTVCTAAVYIWEGPLTISEKYKVQLMGDDATELTSNHRMAKAGGYGYCKFSQAVGEALKATHLNGCGEGAVREFFENENYDYITII